jgi:hypothetical protein
MCVDISTINTRCLVIYTSTVFVHLISDDFSFVGGRGCNVMPWLGYPGIVLYNKCIAITALLDNSFFGYAEYAGSCMRESELK